VVEADVVQVVLERELRRMNADHDEAWVVYFSCHART
jgi:hypothetical protein